MRRLSPTVITVIAAILALLLVGYVFAGGSREDTDKLTDEQVAGRAEANPRSEPATPPAEFSAGSEPAAPPAAADQGTANEVAELRPQATAEPQQPEAPRQIRQTPPANAPETIRSAARRPRATASPSFNCRRARSRSEVAVCENAVLASLDRQMAGDFNRAMSSATPEQRVQLQRTRTRFLAKRESCPSVSCIAEAYRARMREIGALVATRGPPQPARPTAPSTMTSRSLPAQPAAAGPSFNCRYARTRGEVAVCKDPGLAGLDRQMAASFSSAMARGTPAQRELLQQTRLRFLTYRDSCRSKSCVAASYRSRLKEISDIMAGRWKVY